MRENFSKSIQNILKFAKERAVKFGHSYVGSEHLLLGILKDSNCKAAKLLITLGCDFEEMKQLISDMVKPSTGSMTMGHLPLTRRAERILRTTYAEAKKIGLDVADDTHLLLAISKETEGLANEVLLTFSIDYDLLYSYLETSTPELKNKKQKIKKSNTPTLDLFSRDISKLALDGKLDPVIGRELEIERVAQVLSRRKKNNPVLIGEPGVGKTAIVEGLALRIHEKSVPRILWGQRVIALDLAGLIAGTKYRGQFEERMKSMMHELENSLDIIIFIDELHTLVGAGNTSGSLDAANMFKPALARGEIQLIGATTLDEYRKFIEKDGALERRFQKIIVNPPSFRDTVKILKGIQEKYEQHHSVKYSEKAIKSCVELSGRYITEKFHPDKAIDVMDEVGSRVRINKIKVPSEILELEEKITVLKKKKENVIRKQQFEHAAKIRDSERKLQEKLDKVQKKWEETENQNLPVVSEEEVANVVSMMTGIPLHRVAESEQKKLISLEKNVNKQIIGQEEPIEKLTKSILRARTGFNNPNRPIGSFLFLGPTGVGKTELTKVIASHLFGNDDSLIKIDMSEYMERYNVSRLIGAPPGYVGYEEGGQLTEKVRRNPFSVVLFDEIEKAHRDVFNILLQILDEGFITDSLGRRVDFRNTIIILTSNMGTRHLQSTSFGFLSDTAKKQNETDKELVLKEVKRFFNPEFLNRLDEIINFNKLSKEDLIKIIDIQLKDIKYNLKKKNVTISIRKKAKEILINEGNHREWGARPLRRVIQNQLENVIAEKFLTGDFSENGRIIVSTKKNHLVFRFEKNKLKTNELKHM
ncbi:MAG: ATP-dependent Clp protease ATP-binding subunit [Candidatus Neomarinimicrobiota bacterium]|nr:ATP-dependent Clp protease ATP-binding subunit [Candidatus Neomarinimicrobiota bacterium]